MIIESMQLFIALLIPIGIGYSILTSLLRKTKLPITFNLAVSYGLGLGVIVFCLFFQGILGIPFKLWITYGIVCGGIGFMFLLKFFILKATSLPQRNFLYCTRSMREELSACFLKKYITLFLYIVFFVLISHSIFYIFWKSINEPIYSWDALATVALKAKIFFFEKHLPPLHLLPHPTYPLFVPLAETWIILNLGMWNDLLIKIIFPCALLSYLIIHYHFLAYYTNRLWALLGCVLLLSSNLLIYHSTISFRDIFLMYFNCITIIFLILWYETKDSSLLLIAALFAGFTSFTKLEGTAFLIIYTLIVLYILYLHNGFVFKKNLKNFLIFTIPSYVFCLSFHIYKIMNNVVLDGQGICDKTGLDFHLGKILLIPNICYRFIENMIYPGEWSFVWVIFFLSLMHLKKKSHDRRIQLIGISMILFFALYFCVALFTVNYVWIAGELRSTLMPRIILHFYPLGVLLLILLNYPDHITPEDLRKKIDRD